MQVRLAMRQSLQDRDIQRPGAVEDQDPLVSEWISQLVNQPVCQLVT